ncbi:MarR family transcriptional regulator [Arcanobacterium hippocoleae]
MIALAEAPAHTLKMAKLAQQIVFSVARLSYRVRILEERGWIAKTACPNDKRASNLQLTKLGLNILTKIGGAHHRHIEESFTSKLTHEEISALSAISQKLAHP